MFYYKNFKLDVNGVYEPREDSLLLAKVIENVKGKKVLEIGCGSGFLSILLAKYNNVTCVDIDKTAVSKTMKNAELNNVKLKCFTSDLFSNVSERYDLIIFNPPYLPEKISKENIQWAAGENLEIIKRFVKDAKKFLNETGEILLVISSITGKENVLKFFEREGFKTEFVAMQKIPWEELYVIRAFL